MKDIVTWISDFITHGPFEAVFIFLYVVVNCRAQGTYWVGRGAIAMVTKDAGCPDAKWRGKAQRWINSDSTQRGIRLLHRRGWPIVPFCFLTIGLQTIVLVGAGVLRMPWPFFTLIMQPGALAWALIYSTVGFVAFRAAVATAAGSPLGVVGLAVIAAGVVAAVVIHRSRARAREERRRRRKIDHATNHPCQGTSNHESIAENPVRPGSRTV